MRKIGYLYWFFLFTFTRLSAQAPADCSPVKEGKICYSENVQVDGITKDNLYRIISAWAKKNYGKDIFISNVSTNRSKGPYLLVQK